MLLAASAVALRRSPVSSPRSRGQPKGGQLSRPPLAPTHAPVPARHYVADDDDDDDGFWSDDSLQKDKNPVRKPAIQPSSYRSKQQDQDDIAALIGEDPRHMGSADNMTCVSALTMDTETASFDTSDCGTAASNTKKKKKKKKEVWKMQPIAIKPYVPVPETSKDIRA
jgi:hypothetical protein